MAQTLRHDVDRFAKEYAALFSSTDCSDANAVAGHAKKISECYRPGFTVFTNGDISRFATQEEAAKLIETEMRNNIATNTGTNLELLSIHKIETYSQTSAICWIDWCFHPAAGSPFAGKDWRFTNIYGYRAAGEGKGEGWEFVLRDEEVNAMVMATGTSFLS